MKNIKNSIISSCVMFSLFTVLFLSSCSAVKTEKTRFSDENDMKSFMSQNFWIKNSETANNDDFLHYEFYVFTDNYCFHFDLARALDMSLEDMLDDWLLQTDGTEKSLPYENITDFLVTLPEVEGLTVDQYKIVYFPQESEIRTVDHEHIWYIDGLLIDKTSGGIYAPEAKLTELETAYDTLRESRKAAFLEEYETAITYIDAKYSPYSSLGSNFIIKGRAELDDYYNYDYRNMEMVYFFFCFTPEGGGFSDRWYIYGSRLQSQDQVLFEKLKEDPINDITLVCRSYMPDSLKEGMADLVDYFIE